MNALFMTIVVLNVMTGLLATLREEELVLGTEESDLNFIKDNMKKQKNNVGKRREKGLGLNNYYC